jgi:DNA-binding CsgD family transcriptional regulator
MLTPLEKERLGSEILRSTHEAVDLEDFGSRVLPLIDRLFDTSTSLLYRCNERREIVPLAGDMAESVPFYAQYYFSTDPLQKVLQGLNPWMLHGASMPNWKEYLASAAYHECATRQGIDNFIHLRLKDCGMYDAGMVGVMVARTFRQPDFDERERLLIGSLVPALEAFVRRNERLDERLRVQQFVEVLFESHQRPTVVLDCRGGFVWASERAEALLSIRENGRKRVPEVLEKAARELGALVADKNEWIVPSAAVAIPGKDGVAIPADLRLARTRNGARFVVAELEDPEVSPCLAEIAARYRLTKSETQVLHLLSGGLSDRQIGRRLFVAPSTIHSHVNHILRKLAVNSRIQAALMAHGRQPLSGVFRGS